MTLFNFSEKLSQRPLICDGAMGSLLLSHGVEPNLCLEKLNLSQPSRILRIHEYYRDAGADILQTNTFGANSLRLAEHGFYSQCREINRAGVQLARQAAGNRCMVAGSVGPLGISPERFACLLDISNNVEADVLDSNVLKKGPAYAVFAEQIAALLEDSPDLLILETFQNLDEILSALKVARALTNVPLIASMTPPFDATFADFTVMKSWGPALEQAGADVIAVNCIVASPLEARWVRHMTSSTRLPVAAQPSAGIPTIRSRLATYPVGPEEFAESAYQLLAEGVRIIGGCCGTTPGHIAAAQKRCSNSF
jgi:methionine synthase I (cobalamin-dependent)